MEVRNEHGRPEGRPCIQHGKAGVLLGKGSHRIRPWRHRMSAARRAAIFILPQEDEHSAAEAGSAAAGAAILSQAVLQSRSSYWSRLRPHKSAALAQHSASMAPWEWPWSSQDAVLADGSRRGSPWPRDAMEKIFIGLSFPNRKMKHGSQRALNNEFGLQSGQGD